MTDIPDWLQRLIVDDDVIGWHRMTDSATGSVYYQVVFNRLGGNSTIPMNRPSIFRYSESGGYIAHYLLTEA